MEEQAGLSTKGLVHGSLGISTEHWGKVLKSPQRLCHAALGKRKSAAKAKHQPCACHPHPQWCCRVQT